ncbi:aldo/keto reductase family protein [Burkholderia cepacia]|nr:aldo/keto reductase family protein [Burkholderia cepacia]
MGKVLKDLLPREELVLATKVYFQSGGIGSGSRPNKQGLSRKAIMSEIDASLTRLGTDYVDLYQIHRWDYKTPPKKRWKRFTVSFVPARLDISALRRCTRGNSQRHRKSLVETGGRLS